MVEDWAFYKSSRAQNEGYEEALLFFNVEFVEFSRKECDEESVVCTQFRPGLIDITFSKALHNHTPAIGHLVEHYLV